MIAESIEEYKTHNCRKCLLKTDCHNDFDIAKCLAINLEQVVAGIFTELAFNQKSKKRGKK